MCAPDGMFMSEPSSTRSLCRVLSWRAHWFSGFESSDPGATLLPSQFFHVWTVRSRFDSFFAKNPFRNMHMNIGVLLEVRSACTVLLASVGRGWSLAAHMALFTCPHPAWTPCFPPLPCPFQLAILVIVIWVPGVQSFFGTTAPPAISLVPCLFFALLLLVSSEYFKYARKANPRAFALLQF